MINPKKIWVLVAIVAIVLAGCVKSDVGVQFDSPNRGEIVQQIQFDERLQRLSGDSLLQWIRAVERRVSEVGGSAQKAADQTLTIKIPFTNSDELEQKFNQFFESVFNQEQLVRGVSLPAIASHLTVTHSNFLLLEREHLTYAVDLRSLGVLSSSGDVLISPASLIRLQFQLKTPWGARSVGKESSLRPRSLQGSKTLIWSLTPGEQNTIEAVFWMPNPIGIGTLLILLLVFLGRFLKYPQLEVRSQPTGIRGQESGVRS
ncbi:MAG: DUF3153 domain-containing protein [Leptolyngbyaceae cyanobacterium bins.302]|nr:DUF3153 domain-containing protein [Leptolyngbyaceae cyanobacterium bins.302]